MAIPRSTKNHGVRNADTSALRRMRNHDRIAAVSEVSIKTLCPDCRETSRDCVCDDTPMEKARRMIEGTIRTINGEAVLVTPTWAEYEDIDRKLGR